ncbi:pentatricopeptide repeat-containing protein At2g21090-like [Phragmites australis]|uniref:pentatricopeptide repeat-containing protein At2g21090-like n=1 Tax=Phragmites australis TaxID=29695 RepID=UPI002D775E24|nr:pentatricopeptide repeat-containing protein At2g21090-like [Phragmites australis]
MPAPGGPPPPASSPPYSGLFAALHHCISGGNASAAVSLLPTLARAGLRAPFPLLSSLARLLLLRPAAPAFPSLAGRLLLYVRLAGLKRLVPCSTQLANRLLSLHFLLGRPGDARGLFAKMPRPSVHSYNAMLAGYARLALAGPAAEVFAAMPHRDLVSYNAALLALARGGEMQGAMALYSELRNMSPSLGYSHHTFLALLIACAELMDGELATQLHAHLAVLGFLSDVNIASSLIEVYRKRGCVDAAAKLFDEMPVKDLQMWTTIVCAYAEDGQLAAARRIFDQMPDRNIFSWNALIEGFVSHGQPVEALDMFQHLMMEDLRPDQFTFASCLSACSAMCSLNHGLQIHGWLLRTAFDRSVMIMSSLIDMYSKCDYLAGAKQVFSLTGQERRGAVLWNGMLSALCHHGHAQEAIELFVQMLQERLKPDANTFLLVFTACCHCSLVEEGVKFFGLMTERYKIVPGEDHYIRIVDLDGHADKDKDFGMLHQKEMAMEGQVDIGLLMGVAQRQISLKANSLLSHHMPMDTGNRNFTLRFN